MSFQTRSTQSSRRTGAALATPVLALCLWTGPSREPLSAEALGSRESAQLTVLHIADVYQISPVDGGKAGGLARLAALKKSLQNDGREVLVTLAGDFLSPSVASSVFEGEQMTESLGAMGLDLATLGNHEFDFGPDLLRQRMNESPWSWVVSNVIDEETGRPFGGAPEQIVREYGSLKVGFLGLCLAGEEISPDNRRGVAFLDPFESAERIIPRLLEQGVDVVVALTHLDFADDVRLAQRFPEIDLVLGGHEHFPITTHVERTLITKPGSDARFVSRLDISRPSAEAAIETHFELLPVTEELGEEPSTAKIVARWEERLDTELDVVVGSTAEPLDAVAERVRSGQTNLGNLFADAMRWDAEADIAIINGGSIRSNRVYPTGELTRRDLVAMHPFGGITCAVDLPGRLVIEALEHGVGRLGESVGRFPQVSGISFEVDPELPAGDRVRNVVVGREPLDPDRRYRVAIGDYMLSGGDGYSMFAQGDVVVGPEEGSMLVAGLEGLVRELGQVAPGVEGRIRFAGEVVAKAPRRRVILDTDMGIDSVMGMLYLLRAPEVDVQAITVVHGIADVKPGGRNAVRILELTGDTEIPVARGQRRPLEGRRAFPDFWKPQTNRLGGADLPEVSRKPGKNAVDLMISTLESSRSPMTIVAMGPLTNVAQMLARRPDLTAKIDEIVVMGGALDVAGNVGTPYVGIDNYVAEWNFYLDPQAAEQVLGSGVRIRLLPLDSTRALPVTPEFVDRIRRRPRDETSELLLSLLEAVDEGIEAGWYYFWDVLAAVATARPDILACRDETIEVVTHDGPTLGESRIDENGAAVCVGEEINRQAFEEHFLKAILE